MNKEQIAEYEKMKRFIEENYAMAYMLWDLAFNPEELE